MALFPGLLLLLALGSPLLAQEPLTQEPPTTEPQTSEGNPTSPEFLPVPDLDSVQEQKKPAKELQDFNPSGLLFEMVGNLMLVLGLMLLLAWLAKRYLPKKLGALGEGEHIKLLQSLPLGPRRFVSLVEADGKRFLLGVTDNQINLLKALDETPFDQALSGLESPQTVSELMEQEP